MTSFQIGLIVFACVFGGALAGMFLGRVLPPHHSAGRLRKDDPIAPVQLSTAEVLSINAIFPT